MGSVLLIEGPGLDDAFGECYRFGKGQETEPSNLSV